MRRWVTRHPLTRKYPNKDSFMKKLNKPRDNKEKDKMEGNILLDHVWEIFQNQDDCTSDALVNAALYLSSQHDFDIEVLPPHLYDKVAEKIKVLAKESHYDDVAESIDDKNPPDDANPPYLGMFYAK